MSQLKISFLVSTQNDRRILHKMVLIVLLINTVKKGQRYALKIIKIFIWKSVFVFLYFILIFSLFFIFLNWRVRLLSVLHGHLFFHPRNNGQWNCRVGNNIISWYISTYKMHCSIKCWQINIKTPHLSTDASLSRRACLSRAIALYICGLVVSEAIVSCNLSLWLERILMSSCWDVTCRQKQIIFDCSFWYLIR